MTKDIEVSKPQCLWWWPSEFLSVIDIALFIIFRLIFLQCEKRRFASIVHSCWRSCYVLRRGKFICKTVMWYLANNSIDRHLDWTKFAPRDLTAGGRVTGMSFLSQCVQICEWNCLIMAKSCVLLVCGKTTPVFLMVSYRYFIYLIGPMVMIMSINVMDSASSGSTT